MYIFDTYSILCFHCEIYYFDYYYILIIYLFLISHFRLISKIEIRIKFFIIAVILCKYVTRIFVTDYHINSVLFDSVPMQ